MGADPVGMSAVIVAGGRGTRLSPLTDSTPKAMIKVQGRTIVERLVSHLSAGGVSTAYLSVGYLAQQIEDYLGDGRRFGCAIHYLCERPEEPLGTAGWISLLPEHVQSEPGPLLVVNGDLLTDFPVADLVKCHDQSGADATVCVRDHGYEVPFGVVRHSGGKVERIVEKPLKRWTVNAGIYALSPGTLRWLPRARPLSMVDVLNQIVAAGGEVGTFPLCGTWVDIGNLTELEQAGEQI